MKIISFNKDKKIKLSNLFFFISYFLYIFATLCSEFNIDNAAIKTINIACLIASFLAIFKKAQKRNLKNIIILMLLFILSSYLVLAISDSNAIIYLFTLSAAAKSIEKDKIIKTDLLLKIVLVLIVMTGDKLGIIQGRNFSREGEVRNSFGFHHPNFAGLIFLNIYLDIIFLRKEKRKTNLLLAIPFTILIAEIIDSRNAAYGVVLSSILQLIPISRILNTAPKRIAASNIIIGALTAVSLYFAITPMSNTTKELDTYLSGRITYAQSFYGYYGINLLGNKFEKYGKQEYGAAFFVLDNGYLYLLIHNGIAIFTAIMVFYMSKMDNSLKENHNSMYSALIAFACIGLMEQAMFQPIKNPFLLLPKNESEESKNENPTNS